MALTQESILSFLLEHGGKVKNSELLNNFRSQISCCDPAEKQHNRDLFKKFVNSVAVVRQIDEVKFVVVKKRYQDFVKDDASQETQMGDSFSSQNASFSYASPQRAESARMVHSDIENNNACFPSYVHDNATRASAGGVRERRTLSKNTGRADTATVKVLNLSGDRASRAGIPGAVFAVIAVNSPPTDSATRDGLLNREKPSHKPITLGTNVSAPSVPALNSPACDKDAPSDSRCWKSGHAGEPQPPGVLQLRPQNKTARQGDEESVPLEPLAHEWLVKCAAGLWGHIYGLLLQDTQLARKKDFTSGFTALHWAAKHGNSEIIHKLVDICARRGAGVDVNGKAHGGYTPLHIAAIHGHAEVMATLVQSYGAGVDERDNDGKKAVHYLGKGVSAEVRALLGGPQQSRYREKAEDGEYREHPRGFNTISKLFQPHMGRKQKATAKFAHDW